MLKKIAPLFLIFSLSGCGQGNNSPMELTEAVLGSELVDDGVLAGAAKQAALRICYAYQSKNSTFRSSVVGTAFTFTVNYTDCSNAKLAENQALSTTLREVLSSQPMVYDSTSTLPYMKNVETHQHGELVQICDKLFKGEDATTVVDVNSEQKKQFRFGTSDSLDHYSIALANRSVSTRGTAIFAISEEYRYYVNTSSDAAADKKGGVYKYSFRKSCATDTQEETFTQDLN